MPVGDVRPLGNTAVTEAGAGARINRPFDRLAPASRLSWIRSDGRRAQPKNAGGCTSTVGQLLPSRLPEIICRACYYVAGTIVLMQPVR